MGLLYAEALRDRLAALVAELEPLHSVCGLGFDEPQRDLLDAGVSALSQKTAWRFVDLRELESEAAAQALRPAGEPGVLVTLVRAGDPGAALERLVRAKIDGRPKLELAGGELPIAAKLSLFVVCVGCKDLTGVARELGRIPYWDFIP